MSVLIVEPNHVLSATYQSALTRAGWQALLAGNAQEALEIMEMAHISLIVLELQLPGHSGLEFLHEVRSYAEWQSISVVLHTFISHNDLGMSQTQLRQFGVVAYFYKPQTTLQQLVRTVKTASGGAGNGGR